LVRTLDTCIDFVAEINHALKNEFGNLVTWIIVKEKDEASSSIDLHVADGKPPSFARITIDSSKMEDEAGAIFVEIVATMELDSSLNKINLDTITAQSILEKHKRLRPVVILGVLSRLGEKNEPRIVTNRTLEIRLRIFEGQFSESADSSVLSEPGISAVEKLEALYQIYNEVSDRKN
jgi:hypothetical protein